MEFKKVFRGYDPKQVDRYIAETAERESSTLVAQRDRIDELSEENYNLRERITELTRRQNDVAEVMLTAQRVANDIEQNAKDYADRALVEAKKFYATWQAYSKTIVASFSEDELKAFADLENKIGNVITEYERKLKGDEPLKRKSKPKLSPDEFVKQMELAAEELNARSKQAEQDAQATESEAQPAQDVPADADASEPSAESDSSADAAEKAEQATATVSRGKKSANPVTRIEQASGQSVELMDLLRPKESLEDICADLGLLGDDE